jgi:hypothetical protein
MVMTKAQRRQAGKKGAATRQRNQIIKELGGQAESPHEVETPDEQRTSEQDVSEAMGFEVPAADAEWTRPSELEAPEPRPGYTQRWVRVRLGNEEDARNSMRKIREGWLPRSLDSCPEGYAPPTFLHSRLGNVIGVEDLILCEMPIKKAAQRNAHFMAKRDRMLEGIENDLRNVSRGGPRIAATTKTQVTKRRLRVPTDPTE